MGVEDGDTYTFSSDNRLAVAASLSVGVGVFGAGQEASLRGGRLVLLHRRL